MDKQTRSREFLRRFEQHERELRALYLELYHGDTTAYEYFTEMLRRMWSERSEELRCIDRERLNNPDWYKGHDLTGMQLYVGAFAGNITSHRFRRHRLRPDSPRPSASDRQ